MLADCVTANGGAHGIGPVGIAAKILIGLFPCKSHLGGETVEELLISFNRPPFMFLVGSSISTEALSMSESALYFVFHCKGGLCSRVCPSS